MSDQSLGPLTRDTFIPHLGERFVVKLDDAGDLELKLAEANALGGDADERDPFALIFLGPMEPVLAQAIYALEHAELGRLGLFLVPVGPDRNQSGIQYEAVFS